MPHQGVKTSHTRSSLREQIYEQLRDDIVYMRYEPGQAIYENEIADRLNVSRTPVREAFRLLANEHLIEVQPQRGTRVSLISVAKVKESWFIRELLESGAFREAAEQWSKEVAAAYDVPLRQALQQQEEAAHKKDIEALIKLDEEFHRLVMTISGNQTLLGIIDQLRAHINRTRLLSLKENEHLGLIIAEHADLLHYIQAKDKETTEHILYDHLGRLNDEIEALRSKYPTYFTD